MELTPKGRKGLIAMFILLISIPIILCTAFIITASVYSRQTEPPSVTQIQIEELESKEQTIK